MARGEVLGPEIGVGGPMGEETGAGRSPDMDNIWDFHPFDFPEHSL